MAAHAAHVPLDDLQLVQEYEQLEGFFVTKDFRPRATPVDMLSGSWFGDTFCWWIADVRIDEWLAHNAANN